MRFSETWRLTLAPYKRIVATLIQGLPLFVLFTFLLFYTTFIADKLCLCLLFFFHPTLISSLYVSVILTVWSVRMPRLKYALVTLVAITFVIDMYCLLQHGCRFNVSLMELIAITHPNESNEYLSQYLLTGRTLSAVLYAVIPIALLLTAQHFWQKHLYHKAAGLYHHISALLPSTIATLCKIGAIFILTSIFTASILYDLTPAHEWYGSWQTIVYAMGIATAILGITFIAKHFSRQPATDSPGFAWWLRALSVVLVICSLDPYLVGRNIHTVENTSLQAIPTSYTIFKHDGLDVMHLTEVNRGIVIDESNPKRFKIVVIIGESFNKHHAPQYGYPINTMPLLSAETDSNLYVFTNAVTPYLITAEVMLDAMSTKALTDTAKWDNCPIFPAIMHKAGWSISLADNQYAKKSGAQTDYGCSHFYSTEEMSPLCFDLRNETRWDYDGQLLDNCLEEYSACDMMIVHLRGQHIQVKERYPSEFDRLKASDYGYRTDLNDDQKTIVAQYDNATLYQDHCIARIIDKYRAEDTIIIFFSDHGEEVYDFRDQYGRTHGETPKEAIRCLFEVPYFVWVSDSFRANYPEKTAAIARAVNYPIRNTDLSHVLIDLAGIKTASFNPRLSWLNDNSDQQLKRKLNAGQDYDEIMK